MFSAACLLISLAILFFVLKYRVLVHVMYTRPKSHRAGSFAPTTARQAGTRPLTSVPAKTRAATLHGESGRSGSEVSTASHSFRGAVKDSAGKERRDLESALVNLGAKRHRAKAAAEHVMRNYPAADFDTQLRAALNEVQAA